MKGFIYGAALFCCVMSLWLLFTMGADKLYAKSGHRRVPEKRLFLLALLGGAPGGLLGMYAFRHKTRHPRFLLGFWALALLQLGALGYCAYRYM